jgi:hypothetical protein
MSTNGFDSLLTPSKDMLKVVEPTNNIFALVDGIIIVPNIEFSKCNNQVSKLVIVVEAMATIYNLVLIIDGTNFLDILPIQSTSESQQRTYL